MPVSVVAPSGVTFVSIVAGWYHNCGLTAAGAAYCWGFNDYGRLGDGTLTNRAAPAAVAGGLVFSSLSAGVDHTCGMTTSGVVYCWGSNSDGQLGNGTTVDATIPVLTSGVLSPARARRGTLRDPRSD
jgi:alpha-tubulin suppressor-like RCC1 family protein